MAVAVACCRANRKRLLCRRASRSAALRAVVCLRAGRNVLEGVRILRNGRVIPAGPREQTTVWVAVCSRHWRKCQYRNEKRSLAAGCHTGNRQASAPGLRETHEPEIPSDIVDLTGGGGQNRTADLRVMSRVPAEGPSRSFSIAYKNMDLTSKHIPQYTVPLRRYTPFSPRLAPAVTLIR
jgi:hypothetical protein